MKDRSARKRRRLSVSPARPPPDPLNAPATVRPGFPARLPAVADSAPIDWRARLVRDSSTARLRKPQPPPLASAPPALRTIRADTYPLHIRGACRSTPPATAAAPLRSTTAAAKYALPVRPQQPGAAGSTARSSVRSSPSHTGQCDTPPRLVIRGLFRSASVLHQ